MPLKICDGVRDTAAGVILVEKGGEKTDYFLANIYRYMANYLFNRRNL